MNKPTVLLLGPSRGAVSGVSTHLNQLFASVLSQQFVLRHFQVGREGRTEAGAARMLRLLTSPLALAWAQISQRVAIVHINTSLVPRAYWRDAMYLLAARLCGRKVVWQVHGGSLPQDFFAVGGLLSRSMRRLLQLPAAIVVLGQAELEAYRRFVPSARTVLIPNAVSATANHAGQSGAPERRAAPLHVVYVGRLTVGKGLMEIIEAARLLREQGTQIRVTLAGAGDDEGLVRASIKRANLNAAVQMPGVVTGARKDALWAAADVFLCPSRLSEGLPYALLEGMAVGAVPVVSPMGAIRDVVRDGEEGIHVAPGYAQCIVDAIRRLDADRSLLARMSVAARERILQHYTIERLAMDLARLYQSL